ncbi:SDR family NAD(P)-dependent oxidoreductase [Neoroseomonas soli]|uniref:SDR family NAD(P)-dependent oxidoreductase n=1 Tax=Neoroseomonas soli TaxID=1081025 RepID=UPI001BA9AF86
MRGLSGRLALVTGAARGIGLGIATRLFEEGVELILVDVLDEVKATAEDFNQRGGKAEAVKMDITDEGAVASLISDVGRRHQRLDILVNNAGISIKRNGEKIPLEETTAADWTRTMSVNLTAPFILCRAVLPIMRRAGWGRIVNISSQSGRTRPESTNGPYASSKAGLIGFSRVLAQEVADGGITVNSIAPGIIETPLQAMYGAHVQQAMLSRIPMKRKGTPADIAAAVAFLASDDANYITGTVIDVNGGMFMT